MESLFKWGWMHLGVVLLGVLPAAGQDSPYLVEDLDTATTQNGSGFSGGVEMGGYIYFAATSDALGEELWRTDGSVGGVTELVKDIQPGVGSSQVDHLTVMGSTLFFAADDGVHGLELWTSDGTEGGTVMVADIQPGIDRSNPRHFYEVNGDLLFVASDGVTNSELWIYDVSEGEAKLLKDINPGAGLGVGLSSLSAGGSYYSMLNGKLYFTADDGVHGWELWVSDGTEVGTQMVKDINSGSGDGALPTMTLFGSRLFFSGDDGTSGYELWATDGTEVGTTLVKDINPGSGSGGADELTVLGANLVFSATDINVGGARDSEVWISDGTESGTQRVKDIYPGTFGSFPTDFVRVGNHVAFEARDSGTGSRLLWKTDGTELGTVIVGSAPVTNPGVLTALDDNTLLFVRLESGVTGRELWMAKMAENTVTLLKDIRSGSSSGMDNFLEMQLFGSEMFFSASDGFSSNGDPHGELWKTDGTEVGTVKVAEINNSPRSGDPHQMAPLGNMVLFTQIGYSSLNERFLYASDGTPDGVVEVKELGIRQGIRKIIPVGDVAFLLVANKDFSIKKYELWKTDGTAGGTVILHSDIGDYPLSGSNPPPPDNFTLAGNQLFFVTERDDSGRELWASDGTAAGTKMVKDIRPGTSSSSPTSLAEMGGEVYFAADDGNTGRELWKSNGTADGTVQIKNLGVGSSSPGQLVAIGNTLFFAATFSGQRELWKSDGTADGTDLIRDIFPGSGSSFPDELTAVGDTLFFRADDGVHFTELWKSDGTEVGTVMIKDIYPGVERSLPEELTAIDDTLFFTADDGVHGRELWKSDGTEVGTELLMDTRQGSALGFGPQELIRVGQELFFRADSGAAGEELWRSDGTPENTVFFDINSGSAGSGPTMFAHTFTRLFFSATENSTGRELWAIPVSLPMPPPDKTTPVTRSRPNLALITALQKKIKKLTKKAKKAKKKGKKAKAKKFKKKVKKLKKQLVALL